jgi:hypothetical protein
MSWIVFVLGMLLLAVAGVSANGALNLLPTELGLFYANAAALAACAGVITLSIGALIRRVDVLGRRMILPQAVQLAPNSVETAPTSEAALATHEAPIDGAHDPAPRMLIGRRTSNGVDYSIFSDGSIDVNTPGGVRRYASMDDLRASLAPAEGED